MVEILSLEGLSHSAETSKSLSCKPVDLSDSKALDLSENKQLLCEQAVSSMEMLNSGTTNILEFDENEKCSEQQEGPIFNLL